MDLSLLQMVLSARFAQVATSDITHINTLDVGRRYRVTYARRQETRYGLAILLNLRVDPPTNSIKVYFPAKFTEVFLDEYITHINNGTRTYHLVYHGLYPNGRSFHLTLEN